MNTEQFVLPPKLLKMIKSENWPKTGADVHKQNVLPLVNIELLSSIVPEERRVCFYPYPFSPFEFLIEDGYEFAITNLDDGSELDPSSILIIGDFGSGSDTLLALDYSVNINNPRIVKQVWKENSNVSDISHWRIITDLFDDFSEILNLEKVFL